MFFFTIDFYNFLFFILNIFLKNKFKNTHRRIYRRHISIDILHRGKCHTHRRIQTDRVRQHFTEWWKCTLTNDFVDGRSPSAFYRELKNIYRICHYHRWNKFVGIFPARIFYGAYFSSVKPLAIFFFLPTECGITNEKDADCRWFSQYKIYWRSLNLTPTDYIRR